MVGWEGVWYGVCGVGAWLVGCELAEWIEIFNECCCTMSLRAGPLYRRITYGNDSYDHSHI